MATFYYNQIIPSNETERPGMKELYADKSEAGTVRYVSDIVYAEKSGMKLHLQMLYPDIPIPLMEWRREQQIKEDPSLAPPTDPVHKTALPHPTNPYQPVLRMPCVVFVQGSGWGKQDCCQNLPLLIDIARRGIVVASVEYRPVEVAPFPGFVADVKSAIRFLRRNYEIFGIDPTRIAVWGDSSGGHTALMVGTTGWTDEFDDEVCPGESSAVCACVAYYGCSDFTPFLAGGEGAVSLLKRICGEAAVSNPMAAAARLSPVSYLRKDVHYPPFLLMHGDMDATVPFDQSVIMYDKLRELGKRVDFYKVHGANHGQFFWTPEVLRITGEFLQAYV